MDNDSLYQIHAQFVINNKINKTNAFVYGARRIVIKSVQQCTYFLFSVNLLLVGVKYTGLAYNLQPAADKVRFFQEQGIPVAYVN
jgi:hypothetical protein